MPADLPVGHMLPPSRGRGSSVVIGPTVSEVPAVSAVRLVELRARCAELVERALKTLGAVADPDRRFLSGPRSCMPDPVRNIAEGDYPREARRRSFDPSPADLSHYLEVLAWLAWLSKQKPGGADEVRIIRARSVETPYWVLAQRFGRSEKTIRRWEAGAIAKLTLRFWREIDRMP